MATVPVPVSLAKSTHRVSWRLTGAEMEALWHCVSYIILNLIITLVGLQLEIGRADEDDTLTKLLIYCLVSLRDV